MHIAAAEARLSASSGRSRTPLAAVVVGAALFQLVLGLPMRVPRIFGDELIYWELSRSFAWTGHFAVRGGSHPGYGVVYPALISVAHRLSRSETGAYVIAQVINSLLFSLTALPVYAIARRVLSRATALLAATLSVVVPSVVYTSTIMTENAFYPAILVTVLLMLRALERPSTSRHLIVVAAAAIMFLIRAQAVVLLPAFVLAAILLARTERKRGWKTTIVAFVRAHTIPLAALAGGGIVAAALNAMHGNSPLGPYHVLLSSYSPVDLVRWALANVADLELYVGVVPLAAFGVLLVGAMSSPSSVPTELRRIVILTASVGTALLATVAVLSTSQYGLGRVHERNLFSIAPLLLIVFLAWVDTGFHRPRRTARVVAFIAVLLPLTIPPGAVKKSGIEGLALVWWDATRIPSPFVVIAIAAFAAVGSFLFLSVKRPSVAVRACMTVMCVTLLGAELRSLGDLPYVQNRKNADWIDRAVGPGSTVVEIVATSSTWKLRSERIHDVWTNEFFNRSVHDVLSAGGMLPDGLPVKRLTVGSTGCLAARVAGRYAVIASNRPLDAPIVARNPATRSVLYRLEAYEGSGCIARLRSP
jgi:hypothetical protein